VPKYQVTVSVTTDYDYIVDAESRGDARAKALHEHAMAERHASNIGETLEPSHVSSPDCTDVCEAWK
jgi:hypothetical protein